MTTLRQAAQQALEAMETNKYTVAELAPHKVVMKFNDAITALREALAQPEQEPSQWRDMIVVSLVREGINKHRAKELADHFAAQPEQKTCGTCEALARTVMLDQTSHDTQRPWQGLTDEEVAIASAEFDLKSKIAFHAGMYKAQIILRKKNDSTY